MKRLTALILTGLLLLFATASHAVNPDEVLSDPALEQRARDISVNLRCLVCQNQSIDDSDAQLARDLRVLVREQLVAGKSNEQVMEFVVSRYGEFVLLRPTFSTRNFILWATPILVLVIGGLAALRYTRRQSRLQTIAGLTADEEVRLNKLLDDQQ